MTLRTRVAGLTLAPLLLAGLAVAAPATAVPRSAPVTAPDTVSIARGSGELVDLLANDTDADGDELAVCRFGDVPRGLEMSTSTEPEEGPGQVIVFAQRAKPGRYVVTYYACDFESLTPGTLTVVVTPNPMDRFKVRKLPNRPGKLRVVNRAPFAVSLAWGSIEEERPDGRLRIAADSVRVIDVRRPSLFWMAINMRREAFKLGVVRGIKLPPGVDALPPGAPDREALVLRAAGRSAAWRP